MPRPFDRALQQRRDREYERTSNAAELEALQRKWAREDSAAEAAENWRTQEIQAVRRRLAAVEKVVGPGGKGIVDALVGAIGAALRRIRQEEREHTAAAIQTAFDQRCLLDYKGVWSAGQSYVKGSAVTDKGSLWIATGPCSSGERPGNGATSWRLAVKTT